MFFCSWLMNIINQIQWKKCPRQDFNPCLSKRNDYESDTLTITLRLFLLLIIIIIIILARFYCLTNAAMLRVKLWSYTIKCKLLVKVQLHLITQYHFWQTFILAKKLQISKSSFLTFKCHFKITKQVTMWIIKFLVILISLNVFKLY